MDDHPHDELAARRRRKQAETEARLLGTTSPEVSGLRAIITTGVGVPFAPVTIVAIDPDRSHTTWTINGRPVQ